MLALTYRPESCRGLSRRVVLAMRADHVVWNWRLLIGAPTKLVRLVAGMVAICSLLSCGSNANGAQGDGPSSEVDRSWFMSPLSHPGIAQASARLQAELSPAEINYLYTLDWHSFDPAETVWRDPVVQRMLKAVAPAVSAVRSGEHASLLSTVCSKAKAQGTQDCAQAQAVSTLRFIVDILEAGSGWTIGGLCLAGAANPVIAAACVTVAGIAILDGALDIVLGGGGDAVAIVGACAADEPDWNSYCVRQNASYDPISRRCVPTNSDAGVDAQQPEDGGGGEPCPGLPSGCFGEYEGLQFDCPCPGHCRIQRLASCGGGCSPYCPQSSCDSNCAYLLPSGRHYPWDGDGITGHIGYDPRAMTCECVP